MPRNKNKITGEQGFSSTTVEKGDERSPNATNDEKVMIGTLCVIIKVNDPFHSKYTLV